MPIVRVVWPEWKAAFELVVTKKKKKKIWCKFGVSSETSEATYHMTTE